MNRNRITDGPAQQLPLARSPSRPIASPRSAPYEGVVEGDPLTFEGPARFKYRLDESGKVRVKDDGTISVSWWLRDEDGEWQP